MDSTIETLNRWGGHALGLAWPMLWQSSLLIALLFALDFALRRKVRAAIRYAFWLVVLVKLMLPPSLALPTGAGWWLRPVAPAPVRPHRATTVVVSYPTTTMPSLPLPATPVFTPPTAPLPAPLSASAWALLAWSAVGIGLLGWLAARWGQVARNVRRATPTPGRLTELFDEGRHAIKLPRSVRLRLTDRPMSPAVCGLFRPVILLPRALADQLSPAQLRAVLLHELVHLRRGDVWVNCAQALLQIVYWWHPLLWLANARIRRLREEAVDDAVMLALRGDAETYPPTLLEVAKLAFNRPLASLGLVGILESKNALRQRIERLMDFHPPRTAGLTLAAVLCILAFGAVAVPMGEAPPKPATADISKEPPKVEAALRVPTAPDIVFAATDSGEVSAKKANEPLASAQSNTNLWPDPRFKGYLAITNLRVLFLIVDESRLRAVLPTLANAQKPSVVASNEVADLEVKLQQAGTRNYFNSQVPWDSEPILLMKFSGARSRWRVGGYSNSVVMPVTTGGGVAAGKLLGSEADLAATQPDWRPLDFTLVPWVEGDSIRCQVELTPRDKTNATRQAEATIPAAGALIWATDEGTSPGKCQLVVLQNRKAVPMGEAPPKPATNISKPTTPDPITPILPPAAGGTTTNLHTLTFKVEADRFLTVLHQRAGLPATSTGEDQQQAVRKLFSALGADLQPPKGATFNDRNGLLLVRATTPELDAVGAFVLWLNSNELDWNTNAIAYGFGASFTNQFRQQGVEAVNQAMAILNSRVARFQTSSNRMQPVTDSRRTNYQADALGLVAADSTNLYTRTFKVDTNTFLRGLESVGAFPPHETYTGSSGGGGGDGLSLIAKTNFLNGIALAVRGYIAGLGVDLTQPGKAIFFHFGNGASGNEMIVRATMQELDIIEQAIHVLNTAPPQVHIKARFLEITQNGSKALGLDWDLGGFPMTNAAMNLPGRTSPPSNGTPVFPGQPLTNGLRDSASPAATLTGILTDPQFRVVLEALLQRHGVDVLAEPEITMLSGRQAQFKTVTIQTVVTANPQALVPPGVQTTNQSSVPPYLLPQQFEFGPVLDVVPRVMADGYTIALNMTATDTEFLGYDERAQTNLATVYVGGQKQQVNVPMPKFRTHQKTAQVNVFDGQTVVFNLPITTNAPVLGDISATGREFRSESDSSPGKSLLLVFVTPTLIDPAGNRIHGDNEVPSPNRK